MAKGTPGRPKGPGLVRSYESKWKEGLRGLVTSEEWLQEMKSELAKIQSPREKLKLMIELTKFITPQLSSVTVQHEGDKPRVEKIVFITQQSQPKSLKVKAEDVVDAHAIEACDTTKDDETP